MAIRMSGLTSGLDTDAIVQELVSAYSLKTEKYEKQKTKLEWKQDSWKSLNTKIYSLYTNISNLRYSSAYSLKKVSVSDNTKATVTASSAAVNGTQRLNILKTAQSAYVTGGKLAAGTTGDTTLADLGYTGEKTTIKLNKADGTTTNIEVSKNTKISDFITSLSDAGLSASYDATNCRIFVSSKTSGLAGDFSIVGEDLNGDAALEALGLDVALVDDKGNFTASAANYKTAYEKYYKNAQDADGDGVISTDDVQTYIKSLISQYDTIQKDWNSANGIYLLTSAENRDLQSELKELQTKYEGVDIDARKTELEAQVANLESSKTTLETRADELKALQEAGTITDDELAELETVNAELETVNADIEAANAELSDFARMDEIPGLITANEAIIADAEQKRADAKAAQDALGIDDFIAIKNDSENDEETNELLLNRAIIDMAATAVKANEILTDTTGKYTKGGATKIDASDAVITLNGVEFTSSTNTFTINELTIEAQAVTGEGDANAISITTNTDTQAIYDKVKDFLTEYNNLINEMCKLYNAESASDYEPLTDEEKEAMSDEQIEKWETKIKDALLRRDGNLNSIMSVMINSMAQTYKVNGKTYSLSTFGISTLGYLNAAENENYAYHIDGDEDDENTSGKEDELMAAIESDPDSVVEFMKQLASGLYSAIDTKMKSTELSSAYKVYNDKEMDSEMTELEKLIAKWEDKISDREDYYYDKFSAMETALSKLQSQSTSLSGLLGSS